ncbi:hypothetical protein F5Y16DRAFT_420059 [Xylariaceae sp. FL0255]|nr:hypothetical protein F5Y16DRAFT_420059 [Xylariaceae sp. FL0255]
MPDIEELHDPDEDTIAMMALRNNEAHTNLEWWLPAKTTDIATLKRPTTLSEEACTLARATPTGPVFDTVYKKPTVGMLPFIPVHLTNARCIGGGGIFAQQGEITEQPEHRIEEAAFPMQQDTRNDTTSPQQNEKSVRAQGHKEHTEPRKYDNTPDRYPHTTRKTSEEWQIIEPATESRKIKQAREEDKDGWSSSYTLRVGCGK